MLQNCQIPTHVIIAVESLISAKSVQGFYWEVIYHMVTDNKLKNVGMLSETNSDKADS